MRVLTWSRAAPEAVPLPPMAGIYRRIKTYERSKLESSGDGCGCNQRDVSRSTQRSGRNGLRGPDGKSDRCRYLYGCRILVPLVEIGSCVCRGTLTQG